MNTGEDVLTSVAFWVQAGHLNSGMDNMARAGVSRANVPPCRMGSLHKVTEKGTVHLIGCNPPVVLVCFLATYVHLHSLTCAD